MASPNALSVVLTQVNQRGSEVWPVELFQKWKSSFMNA